MIDEQVVLAIKKWNATRVGAFISKLTKKSKCPELLVLVNIACTLGVGIATGYSAYRLIGVKTALTIAGFTALVILSLLGSLIAFRLGKRALARQLVIFGMMFSMPFGLFSAPFLMATVKR